MVSWKGGLVLVALLAALGVYALVTRPAAPRPAASLVPCDVVQAVYFRVQSPSRTTEVERDTITSPWRLTQPAAAVADPDRVTTLVNAMDVIKVQNTIAKPEAASTYGLDPAREILTCRLREGSSYTLSVGSPSFDGSGYYARKGGDNRVYVISSVEVQLFDQALAQPPVKPTPSP
jgi:Domain of unknown function (DUF4340)